MAQKTFTYNRISSILKSHEKKSGDPFLQKNWDKKGFLQRKLSFYYNWKTQTKLKKYYFFFLWPTNHSNGKTKINL